MTFEELGVREDLLKAIGEMGFESPMPVQEKVIPHLLHEDGDVVALAQTGTGKTAAFGLPVIQRIDIGLRSPQALILSPTRELCLQIGAAGLWRFKHRKSDSRTASGCADYCGYSGPSARFD